jgi:hypothetical protein
MGTAAGNGVGSEIAGRGSESCLRFARSAADFVAFFWDALSERLLAGVARAVLGGSGLHSVRLGVEEILRPFEVRIIDLFGCGEVGGSGRSEWQCGHTDASGEAGDPLVCVRMAYPHTVGVVGVLADLMPHVSCSHVVEIGGVVDLVAEVHAVGLNGPVVPGHESDVVALRQRDWDAGTCVERCGVHLVRCERSPWMISEDESLVWAILIDVHDERPGAVDESSEWYRRALVPSSVFR